MPKKELVVKNVTSYAAFLLVFWGLYRFLFKLPDEVEELVIKPLVWLIPVFYLVNKEKLKVKSLGITFNNLFPAIYYSLGLGAVFVLEAVLTNFIKHSGFNFMANIGTDSLFNALLLSFVTAVSEEIAFRGYIFNRIWYALKSEIWANITTTVLWGLIHIPAAFLVFKMDLPTAGVYIALTMIYGAGSSFVFARTGNIASSIFLHVLWEWPIILFR